MKSYAFIVDVILLVLVGITGLILWYSPNFSSALTTDNQAQQQAISSSDQAMKTPDYDAFASAIVGTQFDIRGNKKYQLKAPELRHFNQSNLTTIERPSLLIYHDGNYPWTISASSAQAKNGLKQLSLLNNVQISGAQTQLFKQALLSTSKFNYFPETNIASTDQAIVIKQQNATLSAVGMKILFDSSTIKLLSQVTGQYQVSINPNLNISSKANSKVKTNDETLV